MLSFEEYQQSIKILISQARHYYELDSPIASDNEYDELYKEIQAFEEENPSLISKDSPTQKVGGEISNDFSKNVHLSKMWSLEDIFNEDDLQKWLKKLDNALLKVIDNVSSKDIDFCISPKYDGISLNLVYENGALLTATTRGNGVQGELVTNNAKEIKDIPHNIDFKGKIEIRGEVLMSKINFDILNENRAKNNESSFANPRNAVAGSMRVLDSNITKERNLNFVIHGIGVIENAKNDDAHNFKNTHNLYEILLQLKDMGFKILSLNLAKSDKIEDIYNDIAKINKNPSALVSPFLLDGVVITLNDLNISNMLGYTQKAPRFACAYKFSPNEAVVIIKDVIFQVGRTGILTPVAIFDPVFLSGVHIARATLHNYEEILRKDLHILDSCLLVRSGDVIPKITKVLTQRRPADSKIVEKPTHCPVCASKLFYSDIYIYCENLDCMARLKNSILHFCSKKAMNIDGMGEKIIDLLVDKNLIKDIKDIYCLKIEDLLALDGFKEKKAQNIIDSIQESINTRELERFIHALGIIGVGEVAAKKLAKFGYEFYKKKQEDFLEIDGVGKEMAVSIALFCKINESKIEFLLDLIKPVVRIINIDTNNFFYGKKVVITGRLDIAREELKNQLESCGAMVLNTISKNVNYLICGEDSGSKLQKAKELNIDIILQDELHSLLQRK